MRVREIGAEQRSCDDAETGLLVETYMNNSSPGDPLLGGKNHAAGRGMRQRCKVVVVVVESLLS